MSVRVSVPVQGPVEVGVKVRLIVQLEPAATAVPQSLLSLKPLLASMLMMFKVAVPVLVKATFCAGLVVFTS